MIVQFLNVRDQILLISFLINSLEVFCLFFRFYASSLLIGVNQISSSLTVTNSKLVINKLSNIFEVHTCIENIMIRKVWIAN